MQISNSSSKELKIAEWSVNEKNISLYRNQNQFIASDGNSRTFKSPHYHIDYAVNLVRMFRNTIYVNLNENVLDSSCFLPKLCLPMNNNKDIYVALFGRVDKKASPTGEVKGLRWGVFHCSSKVELTFEVNDPVASEFIMHAPNTNRESFEKGFDKNGKPLKKPTLNHFEMDSYSKRFSIKLIYDQDNRIQSIVLSYVSLFNRNIFLDENQWAVTLVSARDSTKNCGSQFVTEKFGHALLACEGVANDGPFLNYIHVTQNPTNRSCLLKKDEAQLEILKLKNPLNSLNGPTWVRSKTLVEKMLNYAVFLGKSGMPLKFAFSGTLFKSESLDWHTEIIKRFKTNPTDEFRKLIFSSMTEIANRMESFDIPSTCLDWTHRIAQIAGIVFCERIPLTSPIKQIEILNSSSIELLSKDCFETEESIKALNQRISSACVILTPNNCPIEKYEIWTRIIWRIKDSELRQIAITLWQKEVEQHNCQNI